MSLDRGPAPADAEHDDVDLKSVRALFRPFAALAYREFRLLWLGQLFQSASMWGERIARSVLAFELTGSAFQLGALEAVRGISSLVFGLAGGVLADRVDRRLLLLLIQTWSLAAFAIMAALAFTGVLQLWHLYAGAVGLALGQSVNQPVRTSVIPSLVPASLVLQSMTLNSVAINATRVTTPALLAWLAAATGQGGWGYAVSAVLYLFILVFTSKLRLPSLERPDGDERLSILRSFGQGLAYAWGHKTLLAQLAIAVGPLALGFSYQAILIVYAVQTLGVGAGGFGLLFTLAGIGSLAGGLTIASRGSIRRHGWVMVGAGTTYGLGLIGMGAVGLLPMSWPLFWVGAAPLMLVGASQTSFRAANNTMILMGTPPELRGRVMSLTVLPQGAAAGGALLAGFLALQFNPAVAMAGIGVLCILVVWGVAAMRPALVKL